MLFLVAFAIEKDHYVAPNQEISIQFNKTVSQTEHSVAFLKKQLQDLGIESLDVLEDNNGSIKITYFSDLDVAFIQNILASSSIDFEVYTIGDLSALPSGLNGKVIMERKNEADRFVASTFNANFKAVQTNPILLKGFKSVSIPLTTKKYTNNTEHNIPEVRAGPVFI